MYENIKIVSILVSILRIIFSTIIRIIKFIMDAGGCLIMGKGRNMDKAWSLFHTNISLKGFLIKVRNLGLGS